MTRSAKSFEPEESACPLRYFCHPRDLRAKDAPQRTSQEQDQCDCDRGRDGKPPATAPWPHPSSFISAINRFRSAMSCLLSRWCWPKCATNGATLPPNSRSSSRVLSNESHCSRVSTGTYRYRRRPLLALIAPFLKSRP